MTATRPSTLSGREQHDIRPPFDAETELPAPDDSLSLPSGRKVVVRLSNQDEAIVIQSKSGQVEMVVVFDQGGPIAKISGADLQIESPGKVGISCTDFEIRTQNQLTLKSGTDVGLETGGALRMRSAGQTFIDGDYVNLNCLSRKGYHDELSDESREADLKRSTESGTAADPSNRPE